MNNGITPYKMRLMAKCFALYEQRKVKVGQSVSEKKKLVSLIKFERTS